MARVGKADVPFFGPEPAQAQTEQADEITSEQKPGITDRIKERFTREPRVVELPDGTTVSASTARFIDANPGATFIGCDMQKMANETTASGMARWVPYRAERHRGCPTKTALKEYIHLPEGRNPGKVAGSVTPETYLSEGGREPICIGRTIATAALRRMQQTGVLGAAGERLLQEQGGDLRPAA